MPYHVGKSSTCPASKPHAVIKDSDGEVMGCHTSEESAQQQIAAIHANEGAAVTDIAQDFHGSHNQNDHGRSAGPKIDRSKPKGTMPKGHTPKIGKSVGETMAFVVQPSSMAITGGGGEGYDLDFQMGGTPWEGILAVEGVETGDGRMFAEGAITWGELPIPLRRNIEDSHGGMPTTKTVLVGRIDNIWRDPEQPTIIRGAGVFDDQGDHGAEALRLVKSKFLKGVSIDPDDIKDADVEAVYPETPDGDDDELMMAFFAQPELTIFHAGRLRAATLVDIPAFIEAKVWLVDPSTVPQSLTAAAHFHGLSDSSWNASDNESRLPSRMSLAVARSAYAHCGTTEDGDTLKVSARFMHHEVGYEGDVGAANLTACSVGIRAIMSGRADALTAAERRSAYLHLAQHLRAAGIDPQPYEPEDDGITAALELLEGPPIEWFETDEPDGFMPPTVMDDVTAAGWRRFAGHGAIWGTCHIGFGGACVEPPHEPNGDHAYYRLGEVVCADGSRVAVGNITLGTGHAPTRGISASQAAEHYDNTGTVVALVASSEGRHGIWLTGAVPPWVDATRVAQLQASGEVSGDWRRIGGSMRLIAFLAVNTPGFPVPRLKTAIVRGKQLALVAAGAPRDDTPRVRVRDEVTAAAIERIAKGIGLDARSRLAALRERVGS